MTSDSATESIEPEKITKKKHKRSDSFEKEQGDHRERRSRKNDPEIKNRKRKKRSRSYDRDHSDQENNHKYDDEDGWNRYSSHKEVRIGSRYYETDKYKTEKRPKFNDNNKEDRSKMNKEENANKEVEVGDKPTQNEKKEKKSDMDIMTRSGGAYIPPAKLRMMQAQITDKSSAAYQRLAWEALKKSIHGHINKVNTTNIGIIVRELFKENIVRGRGLLCRSIIQAQAASPTFTHVYAALVAVINSKFPNIGELLLKRLIIQFRRGFKRNDKSICISAATFIAHLVNQNVAHEILALELLTLLFHSPTDDSVEVAIAFLKECGMKLTQNSKKGLQGMFDMLRNILHEGNLNKRVQYMIEVIFQVRKDNFEAHPAIISELDIVEESDQIFHILSLDQIKDGEDILNVFKYDPEYEVNEQKYSALKKEILDESSDESGSEEDDEDESDSSDEEEGGEGEEKVKDGVIIDNTETNLVALRRTIYLTIQSSIDFEECAHKLLLMELKPGQEIELCHMLLDSCAELRSYEKFFGLLAQRFCQINKIFVGPFESIFALIYSTIHRLDTNKLRNVAKFFAHLLFTDAISWTVLEKIRLNEEDTTSSSRIFIKILFQELSEEMGLTKLNERVKDPTMQSAFDGLFPRDNPKNTRFAINFFTSIGLGGLTDDLREHLKALPKVPIISKLAQDLTSSSSDSSSSDSETGSSSSSSSSSSESSSDSDSENDGKKKKKKKSPNKNKKEAKKNKSSTPKDSKKQKDLEGKKQKKKKDNDDNDDDDDDDEIKIIKHKKRKDKNKYENDHKNKENKEYEQNKRKYNENKEDQRRRNDDERFVEKERDTGKNKEKRREIEENFRDKQRNKDNDYDKMKKKDRQREYDEEKMREKYRGRELDEERIKDRYRRRDFEERDYDEEKLKNKERERRKEYDEERKEKDRRREIDDDRLRERDRRRNYEEERGKEKDRKKDFNEDEIRGKDRRRENDQERSRRREYEEERGKERKRKEREVRDRRRD